MEKPTSVDQYIANNENWQEELIYLRELVLGTGLEETIKWMFPTYMRKGKNILLNCTLNLEGMR